MIHIDLTLEALRIMAKRNPISGHWDVVLIESSTGTEVDRTWSDAQMGALMALSIAGDELPDDIPGYAESACAFLPPTMRPIP